VRLQPPCALSLHRLSQGQGAIALPPPGLSHSLSHTLSLLHRWPFLVGLGASGAIFFKVATSVTGEFVMERGWGGEEERGDAPAIAPAAPPLLSFSLAPVSFSLTLPTNRRGRQALQ
jgi:hypothetical protein